VKKRILSTLFALVLVLTMSLMTAVPALAATAPDLGTAKSFAVLGTAVTLTDAIVTGDVGSTGANVTNTTSTITGTVYEGGADAVVAAYSDFLSAYDALAGVVPDGEALTGTLADITLSPGVYGFDAAATLTGTLTLDAGGDADAVWIFKIGTDTGALTGTNFFSSVVMDNDGVASNVFWWVAEAATLTDSNFQGTILAGADITLTRGTFMGNALATGAVTLTGATITLPAGAVLDNEQVTKGEVGAPIIASVTPNSGVQTYTYLDVAIAGTNLELASAVSFGDDIVVTIKALSAELVTVDIVIDSSAVAGLRDVSVTVATVPEETFTLVDGFTVIATHIEVTAPKNIDLGTMPRGETANSESIGEDAGTVVTNLQSWKVVAKDSALTGAGFMKTTTGGDLLSVALNVSGDGTNYSTADVDLVYVNMDTLPFYVKQAVAPDEGSGSYSITLEFVGSLYF